MRRLRLSESAVADIVDIVAWSHEQFGETARLRYERLISTALRDIAEQPERPGSLERPELGSGVRSWHLALSRDRVAGSIGRVGKPRQFVVYRCDPDVLVVGRVLHDAMELARHLDPETPWD